MFEIILWPTPFFNHRTRLKSQFKKKLLSVRHTTRISGDVCESLRNSLLPASPIAASPAAPMPVAPAPPEVEPEFEPLEVGPAPVLNLHYTVFY